MPEWECRECGHIQTKDMWRHAAEAYVFLKCPGCAKKTGHVKMGGEDD
jgi:Zn finger protein HypA/HybF involved in hydrogenase expression